MTNKKDAPKREVLGLVGIGLDNKDEHKRVTKSEEFLLLGGSEQTHENMQHIAIRFSEALRERGKRLPDAEVDEVIELLHKAADQ